MLSNWISRDRNELTFFSRSTGLTVSSSSWRSSSFTLMWVDSRSESMPGSRMLLAATRISVGSDRERLTNSLKCSSADRISACTSSPSGFSSSIWAMEASKYGSVCTYFFTRKRDSPCTRMRAPPSGSTSLRRINPIVPTR